MITAFLVFSSDFDTILTIFSFRALLAYTVRLWYRQSGARPSRIEVLLPLLHVAQPEAAAVRPGRGCAYPAVRLLHVIPIMLKVVQATWLTLTYVTSWAQVMTPAAP